MFGLNRLLRFINSLKQAIGIDDPDLQHGRIGREEADKSGLRALKLKTPNRLKNPYPDSSQKGVGPAGSPAPEFLPPDKQPKPPYIQLPGVK